MLGGRRGSSRKHVHRGECALAQRGRVVFLTFCQTADTTVNAERAEVTDHGTELAQPIRRAESDRGRVEMATSHRHQKLKSKLMLVVILLPGVLL